MALAWRIGKRQWAPFPSTLLYIHSFRIEGALSYIVTHLSDISQLAAQTDRLEALLAALVQQAEGLPGGVHRRADRERWMRMCGLCVPEPPFQACPISHGMTHFSPSRPYRKPSTDGSIAVQDLTLTTPRGEQTVCRGLTLTLAPGQSLLIVGPSGVGKTSLMRAMAGAAGRWGSANGEARGRAELMHAGALTL